MTSGPNDTLALLIGSSNVDLDDDTIGPTAVVDPLPNVDLGLGMSGALSSIDEADPALVDRFGAGDVAEVREGRLRFLPPVNIEAGSKAPP